MFSVPPLRRERSAGTAEKSPRFKADAFLQRRRDVVLMCAEDIRRIFSRVSETVCSSPSNFSFPVFYGGSTETLGSMEHGRVTSRPRPDSTSSSPY